MAIGRQGNLHISFNLITTANTLHFWNLFGHFLYLLILVYVQFSVNNFARKEFCSKSYRFENTTTTRSAIQKLRVS